MANLIGQSLGRYHILEQLGEGGMATVYKARDMTLERDVAVKVIRNDLFGPTVLERMLKRFEREAKALAKLSHQNIVKILDYGDHNGAPFLVMEYVPGGTLKQKLGSNRVAWQNAVRGLLPIADALSYAHQNKIIHRDIKPSNILIAKSGAPMLSDFGISKILTDEETTELTATGAGMGTPEYMAPEQGMGQADERADIYALGIVLYQMITGHVPFRADTPMAVLLKKNQEPLPRPKQFVPSLPDSVENVLIKVLAKDPQNRYQTAQELVNAFEHILNGGTESVTTTSRKKRAVWAWMTASVIISILVCGIAGIAILRFTTSTNEQPTFQPTETSIFSPSPPTLENTATSTPETPFPTPTLPATTIPSPTFTEESQLLSDPEDFARWYFTSLWTERNYELLWNNCQTESFQNHSSSGDFNEYEKWWSSVKQVEIHSIDVTDNNGSYASINVELSFILNSGKTVTKDTYGYDLIYNAQTRTWMFDYRK